MSLTIEHALFASALHVSLDPSSRVPTNNRTVSQKPTHSSNQTIDNEKLAFPASQHQASEEFQVTGVRFTVLLSGMLMGFFMATLNTTITITALNAMASAFNAADQIGWIGSAYLLTLSGVQPIYCSIADIIGLKCSYLASIALFVLGSVLCGTSSTMNMLIIGRAIQGIGGAGLLTSVLVIICNLIDSRTRAIYQGVLGAVVGLAAIVGPLLGGILADQHQWRWCFYINAIMGAVVFAIVLLLCDLSFSSTQMERQRNEKTLWKQLWQVNYASLFLLIPGVVCLFVGLQMGGDQRRFDTPLVLVLLILGPVLMLLFVASEMWIVKHHDNLIFSFGRHAVLSMHNMAVFVGQFAGGAANYALIYFLPLHFQIVKGDTALASAVELLSFFIPAVLGGGLVLGVVMHIKSCYRFMLWSSSSSSTALSVVGAALLQSCTIDTPNAVQYTYLAILGFGSGIFVVVSQASVPAEDLTIATTVHEQFARLLGGAFGVNLASVMFKYYTHDCLSTDATQEWLVQNFDLLKAMPDTMKRKACMLLCLDAFNKIYLMVAVVGGIAFLSTLFMKKAQQCI